MIKPKTNREAFAEVLASIKAGRGAQSELARRLGVVRQTVCNWNEIPPKYALAVAEILDIPVKDVVPEAKIAMDERDLPQLIRILTREASPCPKKRKSKRRSQA